MDKAAFIPDDLRVGFKASHTRTISQADIGLFASLSGDFSPIHMRQDYAEKTFYGSRIAHGVISLGLLSAAMAKLPGLVIFLSQSVKFLKPVRIGDTITATVEVIEIHREKGIVTLKNTCTNQNGETVVTGQAECRLYQPPR
ncbi:MAG: MaoC family dehydratase [Dehalococcoidales bacterium]